MEQPIIANGGLQIVPQIAVQYVYLDFDGELTSYNGEILTIDEVKVKNSSLTEERIADILAELNAKYASQNVIFVTDKPETAEYSTIYIGKTEAFTSYGNFAGLAETIDQGNQNKSDNAFVMLDADASNDVIISTIAHEADHLLGTLDHGGEGLARYAVTVVQPLENISDLVVTDKIVIYGTVTNPLIKPGAEMHVYNGGKVYNANLDAQMTVSDTYAYVYQGGAVYNTYVYQYAHLVVLDGGVAYDTN
ncbi:MAG: hypothetical protein J6W00_13955, partial [Lentisphaeria bacterium]|nr:hypothetical protein [Lentisphaeria bacterium]